MSEDAKWEAKRSFHEGTGRWYRRWTDPEVHERRSQLESRWVWERAFGSIPKGRVIHHVDGDPTNDALGNLMCLPKAQHEDFHDWLRGEFIWVAGMQWKRCSRCHEYKSPDEFHKHKQGRNGCHSCCKDCRREYKREYRAVNRESINARRRERYAAERAAGRALT